jgi:hypothetical protein
MTRAVVLMSACLLAMAIGLTQNYLRHVELPWIRQTGESEIYVTPDGKTVIVLGGFTGVKSCNTDGFPIHEIEQCLCDENGVVKCP